MMFAATSELSELVQIFTLIVGMVTTCFTAWLTYKLNTTAKHVQKVDDTVQTVAKQTNGLAKALANNAAKAGFAAGVTAEQSKAQALPDAIREAVAGGIADEKAKNGNASKPCP